MCQAVMRHNCRGPRQRLMQIGDLSVLRWHTSTVPLSWSVAHSPTAWGSSSSLFLLFLSLQMVNRGYCLVMFSSLILTFRMLRGWLHRGPCSLQHFRWCSGSLEHRDVWLHVPVSQWGVGQCEKACAGVTCLHLDLSWTKCQLWNRDNSYTVALPAPSSPVIPYQGLGDSSIPLPPF